MLMVSLLITIAVQMVAAVLNLRGFNLAQGLKRSFAVIVPTTIDSQSEVNAKKLATSFSRAGFGQFPPGLVGPSDQATCHGHSWLDGGFRRHSTNCNRQRAGRKGINPRESARRILIALGVDENAIDSAAD